MLPGGIWILGSGVPLGPIFNRLAPKYRIPRATSNFTNQNSSPILTDAANNALVYPVPMFGQGTYLENTNLNEFRPDVRFDYNVSSKDVLTVHYAMDSYPSFTSGN